MYKTVFACHNCTKGRGLHCVHCRRVDQDDIRIQHSPHNKAEFQTSTIQTASGRATSLPEDAEDALRRFLATVAGLDVLSFVAALHFARRGGRGRLAATLRQFAADIRSYRGGAPDKAVIWAKWHSTKGKIPEIAAVRTWAQGHGGRKAEIGE